MLGLLELITSLADSGFSKEVPPAMDAIAKDPIKGILQTAYDIAA